MNGPRVVGIGDSITLGVGDGVQRSRGDVGWAALSAQSLAAAQFTNLAANGARARDMLASQVDAARRLEPDIVFMSVGGNDVLRGDFSPAEVHRCVHESLTALAAPGRVVITVSLDRIVLFDLAPARIAHTMARRVGQANAALHDAVRDAGTPTLVIDGATLLSSQGRRAWHIDRIHPSPAGHRALAMAALGLLEERWPATAPLPACPTPPGRATVAGWLLVNGAPWALKRSRDLIPQVIRVIAQELAAERRERALRPAHAGRDNAVSPARSLRARG